MLPIPNSNDLTSATSKFDIRTSVTSDSARLLVHTSGSADLQSSERDTRAPGRFQKDERDIRGFNAMRWLSVQQLQDTLGHEALTAELRTRRRCAMAFLVRRTVLRE